MTGAAPKTVVITGASSGIGRGLALEWARRGAHVMAVARRESELVSLVDEITAAGGKANHLVCDVGDPTAASEIAAKSEDVLGAIDMIVANAGIGGAMHGTRLDRARMIQMMNVNAIGAMATLAGAIPIFLAQRRGHLVGVSSLAGRRGLPGSAVYSASKAALSTFLESLRIDLANARIKVTDVQAGFVETPLTDGSPHPQPFMWKVDRATRYIADELESAPGVIAFPFPLTALTRLGRVMPFGLYAALSKKVSGR